MNTKVILIFLMTALISMLSIFSCTDCGPFEDKYKLKNIILNFSELSFDEETKTFSGPGDLVSDSLSFDHFNIDLYFQSEYFFSAISPSFGLFPTLIACSPSDPTTDEFITNMKIYTKVSFDENHPVDSSLVDLFDVIIENVAESVKNEKMDLGAYLETQPKVPNELHLRLKIAPEISREYEFRIEYTHNGIDITTLTLQSEKVFLQN